MYESSIASLGCYVVCDAIRALPKLIRSLAALRLLVCAEYCYVLVSCEEMEVVREMMVGGK
jgi:hypothetical protein